MLYEITSKKTKHLLHDAAGKPRHIAPGKPVQLELDERMAQRLARDKWLEVRLVNGNEEPPQSTEFFDKFTAPAAEAVSSAEQITEKEQVEMLIAEASEKITTSFPEFLSRAREVLRGSGHWPSSLSGVPKKQDVIDALKLKLKELNSAGLVA